LRERDFRGVLLEVRNGGEGVEVEGVGVAKELVGEEDC